MGVAFVPAARPPSADFPSWCVVPARRASHIHAIAFEVQHRVVPPKPADQLSETPKRPAHDAGRRVGCKWCVGRELLGIIGDHGRSPCPLLMTLKGLTPPNTRQFQAPCLRNIKRYATARTVFRSAGETATYGWVEEKSRGVSVEPREQIPGRKLATGRHIDCPGADFTSPPLGYAVPAVTR